MLPDSLLACKARKEMLGKVIGQEDGKVPDRRLYAMSSLDKAARDTVPACMARGQQSVSPMAQTAEAKEH